MAARYRCPQREVLLDKKSPLVQNDDRRARRLRVAKPKNSTKNISNEIQNQIAVASNFFANGEKANEQTFKRIQSSTPGTTTATLINHSLVLLACDQLDHQICLTTSLENQNQNISD